MSKTVAFKEAVKYAAAHPDGQRAGEWVCTACGAYLMDSLDIRLHYGLFGASRIYPNKRKVWSTSGIWREAEFTQRCSRGATPTWLVFRCATPEHGWEEA